MVSAVGEEIVTGETRLMGEFLDYGFKKEHFEKVQRGMWKLVHEEGGTARRAQSEALEIAGRTGVSDSSNPKDPSCAWFTAFAPYENPQLAICVLVENAENGGEVCAPIARRILEQALGESEVALEKLDAAAGHSNRVSTVEFESEEVRP